MATIGTAYRPRLLLIDDELTIRRGYSRYLTKAGFDVDCAASLSEGERNIQGAPFAAVLVDVNLPDGSALPWLEELRVRQPEALIVAFSAYGEVPRAVEALKRGAHHFFAKPIKMKELETFLKGEMGGFHLRSEPLTEIPAKIDLAGEFSFGNTPAMNSLEELATLAAEASVPVLLQGETGVGKGKLARWIHQRSPRSDRPFVELNCSALGGSLLGSELFGHTRGAFTSAFDEREGLLQVADGGTLFLDEIGDMPLETQAQLLKVIEEKTYRRLGEPILRHSDFRLICATNRDLMTEIEAGRFRSDLYYRIQVVPLAIPPLRERPDELGVMANTILCELGYSHGPLSQSCLEKLSTYDWPGNVRELRNALERAMLFARGGVVQREHLTSLIPTKTNQPSLPQMQSHRLEDIETLHIKHVMSLCQQDTQKAADLLGISRAALYRRLKKIV